MEKLQEKFKKITVFWSFVCDVLEFILAVLVTVAVVVSIGSLIPGLGQLFSSGHAINGFNEYLEELFYCVIGIEFLKMLSHPSSDNVLETLIFLVARHMIINSTTPKEDLISVCTIVLLVLVRRLLEADKKTSALRTFIEGRSRKSGKEEQADSLEKNS